MFDSAFWRNHPSMSCPEPDDDYLEYEDMERHHHSYYDYDADLAEDEAVERDFGDPLRLAHAKSPVTAATITR